MERPAEAQCELPVLPSVRLAFDSSDPGRVPLAKSVYKTKSPRELYILLATMTLKIIRIVLEHRMSCRCCHMYEWPLTLPTLVESPLPKTRSPGELYITPATMTLKIASKNNINRSRRQMPMLVPFRVS